MGPHHTIMTRRLPVRTGTRSSPVRGGAWVGLIVGVFVGFLLAAGLLAAFLWVLNGTVSAGVEGYLKKYVFDGTRSTFGTFQADLWKGRFVMTDLRLHGERLSVTVPQMTVDIPVRELISGNGVIRTVRLDNPLLEGTVSLRGRGGGRGRAFWPSSGLGSSVAHRRSYCGRWPSGHYKSGFQRKIGCSKCEGPPSSRVPSAFGGAVGISSRRKIRRTRAGHVFFRHGRGSTVLSAPV